MKIDRMISIIMILLERKKVTVAELAKICEVTPRTIQRDLDAINQAGVPIVSYPGVGGGVGIMENYKLEKRLFSTADVTTLLMGLGSVRSSLSGSEVVGALAKIKGMIPEEQRQAIELKAGQLTIDTSPWLGGASYSALIDQLQTALSSHRIVLFSYSDRRLNKTQRRVEPYRLILKTMNWYFEGFCLERQEYRIFKLSRMAEVTLCDETFTPRPFEPGAILQPQFPDSHDTLTATLRVREAAIEPLQDLFGPHSIEPESDSTWLAKVEVFDSVPGYKSLLALGADGELLSPPTLCRHFTQYLAKLAALYPTEVAERHTHEKS